MIEIDKDEHIIFEVRKHWLVFGTEMTFLIILGLLPLFLISFISNLDINFSQVMSVVDLISLFAFFYALWLLILWVIGYFKLFFNTVICGFRQLVRQVLFQ
jgi:hypothetical protein